MRAARLHHLPRLSTQRGSSAGTPGGGTARGNVLATSLFVKTVCADPSLIGTQQVVVARALSPLLKVNEAELAQRLQVRTWTDKSGKEHVDQYVRLKQKVTLDEWEKIQTAMKNLSFGLDEKKLSRRARAFRDPSVPSP